MRIFTVSFCTVCEISKTESRDLYADCIQLWVEIKKEYTAPLYAGYFSESSFLSDSGVCRDLGRTFRNQKSTKTL